MPAAANAPQRPTIDNRLRSDLRTWYSVSDTGMLRHIINHILELHYECK